MFPKVVFAFIHCSHSRSETIRFLVPGARSSDRGPCDLVWMDKTQKTCGLRFTNLPQGAREPMRRWKSSLRQSPLTPSPCQPFSGEQLPLSDKPIGDKVRPSSSKPSSMVSRDASASAGHRLLSRFATGLLVSALVAAPFLFRATKGRRVSRDHWGTIRSKTAFAGAKRVATHWRLAPASQKTVAASRLALPSATSFRVTSEKLSAIG